MIKLNNKWSKMVFMIYINKIFKKIKDNYLN